MQMHHGQNRGKQRNIISEAEVMTGNSVRRFVKMTPFFVVLC